MLSVIIPVVNEEDSILPLYKELRSVLKTSDEILFIDDGSRDKTRDRIKELAKKDKYVGLVSFQRNFGKAAALSSGFSRAKGEILITMDGDLQDDPKEIPMFVQEIGKGFDMVSGWKKIRKDPLGKRLPSKFFNKLTAMLTGVDIHDSNCGFKAYRKKVTEHLNLYGELHRYIPALAHMDGFSVGEIVVNHRERKYGKSKYGIERLAKGFLDLLTVKFLLSYSRRPFHIFGLIGMGTSFIGFLGGLYVVYLKYLGESVGDRPITFLSGLLLIMGLQFFSMGWLAELVNRQSKANHIIREEIRTGR